MTLAIPPSTLDAQALGEEIAALVARLHAATYELLVLLREFDAREQWGEGFTSFAQEFALAGTAAHVERLVGAWRRVNTAALARDAERRHLSRGLSAWVDDDGMVVIRGRLAPEAGAVVLRALDSASDRLFRAGQAATVATITDEIAPRQRRADALALLAEAALAADLDAGSAGDRCQVVVHVEAGTDVHRGRAGGEHAGGSARAGDASPSGVLEVGDAALRVSAETSRRLACDAGIVVMQHDASGTALDVGRKTRSIPSAIRRALSARDRGCRFPGCAARRCDARHVEHWVDGGSTSLDNLMLLCRRHHRLVHEGGVSVHLDSRGSVRFVHRNGWRVDVAPLMSEPLLDRLHGLGPLDAPPEWDGTPLDLVWAMDVLYTSAP